MMDAHGEVDYQFKKEETVLTSSILIIPMEVTHGTVKISYDVYPRKVDQDTHSGPYYDLRCEEHGFTFSAQAVLLSFDLAKQYPVRFDLGNMPPFTQVCFNGTSTGYYACGDFERYDKDHFTIVCCTKPQFDIESFVEPLSVLYKEMCNYFNKYAQYTIIFRQDPYLSRGGSAESDAFMVGYTKGNPPHIEEKYSLFAHEMAHSFVSADEKDEVRSGWFNEAVADYISARFPYYMGLQDIDYYIDTLNDISKRFFDNPYTHYSVRQALLEAWSDTRYIQPLPYGRGYFILCRLEMLLHDKVEGGVLALLQYCGYKIGDFDRLLAYIKEHTGLDVESEIEDMENGEDIDLSKCYFGEGISYRRVKGENADWYEFYRK